MGRRSKWALTVITCVLLRRTRGKFEDRRGRVKRKPILECHADNGESSLRPRNPGGHEKQKNTRRQILPSEPTKRSPTSMVTLAQTGDF